MKHHIYNAFLAVVIAAGMITTFYYLERAFRAGDTRRAVQAVQQVRVTPGGPTMIESLRHEFGPGADLKWYAEIEDVYQGAVRVICELPGGRHRVWRVDVLSGVVSPVN